ncbi:hypothetical protein [Campylobacter sputorum]|uniref:hypothetical protein n=1 Tax=Campylobacter sputorum TaxID=206 RepID=UPI00053C01CF|nr:hypothetical protein [Campylobacter sputorum]
MDQNTTIEHITNLISAHQIEAFSLMVAIISAIIAISSLVLSKNTAKRQDQLEVFNITKKILDEYFELFDKNTKNWIILKLEPLVMARNNYIKFIRKYETILNKNMVNKFNNLDNMFANFIEDILNKKEIQNQEEKISKTMELEMEIFRDMAKLMSDEVSKIKHF